MDILERYNKFISRYDKLRHILVYAALTVELFLMVYERSDLPLSSPKMVFRGSFVLTVLALLLTKYTMKQWIVILATSALCFGCYRYTGNNDLLRFSLFAIACKDEDLDKLLKYFLAITAIGSIGIAFASVSGIYGSLRETQDYGRSIGVETRYVFGFGHPNTVQGVAFSLTVLMVYLVRNLERTKRYIIMALIFAANFGLFLMTNSRTGFFMTLINMVLALIVYDWKKLRESSLIYYAEALLIGVCVGVSIWAAHISIYTNEPGHELYKRIDDALTGRIKILYYDTMLHKGALSTWTLFGTEIEGNSYFDMGWVRLFYWYGIIPAVLIIIVMLLCIYETYKRRNYAAIVLFMSISLLTLIEANYVSEFIGRNYLLPFVGIYLFNSLEENNAGKNQVSA